MEALKERCRRQCRGHPGEGPRQATLDSFGFGVKPTVLRLADYLPGANEGSHFPMLSEGGCTSVAVSDVQQEDGQAQRSKVILTSANTTSTKQLGQILGKGDALLLQEP